jgi:hypothetical protein
MGLLVALISNSVLYSSFNRTTMLSAAGFQEKLWDCALLQSDQLDFAFLCSFQDTKCSLVLMFLFFQLLLPNLHCFRTPEIAATLCLVDFLCFDSGLGISDIFRWLSDLKMYFPLTFSCYFVLSRISALFCGFKVFYPLGFCSDFAISRNS